MESIDHIHWLELQLLKEHPLGGVPGVPLYLATIIPDIAAPLMGQIAVEFSYAGEWHLVINGLVYKFDNFTDNYDVILTFGVVLGDCHYSIMTDPDEVRRVSSILMDYIR